MNWSDILQKRIGGNASEKIGGKTSKNELEGKPPEQNGGL